VSEFRYRSVFLRFTWAKHATSLGRSSVPNQLKTGTGAATGGVLLLKSAWP
jgi:hypothetical protein